MMSRNEKRIARMTSFPRDFRFDELVAVFSSLGFEMVRKGGSHVFFVNADGDTFMTFEPHGRTENVVTTSILRKVAAFLADRRLI